MKPATLQAIEALLLADGTVLPDEAADILTTARTGRADDAVMTCAEVAASLVVSQRTVWRLVEAGDLKPIRLSSRTLRFFKSDVLAMSKKGKRKGKPVKKPKQPEFNLD